MHKLHVHGTDAVLSWPTSVCLCPNYGTCTGPTLSYHGQRVFACVLIMHKLHVHAADAVLPWPTSVCLCPNYGTCTGPTLSYHGQRVFACVLIMHRLLVHEADAVLPWPTAVRAGGDHGPRHAHLARATRQRQQLCRPGPGVLQQPPRTG